jgi:DNA-binding transcriptional MerR regulator
VTDEPPVPSVAKPTTAFRTIGEVATELGIPQHVLRYWEGRFPQLKPVQRAGNRRLYRPADIDLVRRINSLLNTQGYSIRGVQKLLVDGSAAPTAELQAVMTIANDVDPRRSELIEIRALLIDALDSISVET